MNPSIALFDAMKWCNDNQGVVSITVFLITIFFAWASGILSSFRNKTKFIISVLQGPTFCCTFPTGEFYNEHNVHRTAFALYLSIANVGHAPSSIGNISVGYHWDIRPFSVNWVKYKIGNHWLFDQAVALDDFQYKFGDRIKVFPFLNQRNIALNSSTETYLRAGEYTAGVVYFEQQDSWGGCYPVVKNGFVKIHICVNDIHRKKHCGTFNIPSVKLDEARRYNPSFGKTIAELRGETLPFDQEANDPESPT